MKAKIVAANGLDLRLFRTLPDYYRALPGKLSDTLVAMDRAGASGTELARAMGGLRGMRLGMLEGIPMRDISRWARGSATSMPSPPSPRW